MFVQSSWSPSGMIPWTCQAEILQRTNMSKSMMNHGRKIILPSVSNAPMDPCMIDLLTFHWFLWVSCGGKYTIVPFLPMGNTVVTHSSNIHIQRCKRIRPPLRLSKLRNRFMISWEIFRKHQRILQIPPNTRWSRCFRMCFWGSKHLLRRSLDV